MSGDTDNHVVVREIQDLTRAVDETTRAVKNMSTSRVELSLPNVHVAAPEVHVAAPEVKVDVQVPEQKAPDVKVDVQVPQQPVAVTFKAPALKPQSYRVTVTARDDNGFIQEFVIVPV